MQAPMSVVMRNAVFAALISAVASAAAEAKPVSFRVNDPTARDVVSFTSLAPLEMVQGSTNRILGEITIDDSMNLSKEPLKAQFDVDLRTLDTGLPMRDADMRDDFLECTKYPLATFVLKAIKQPVVLHPNKSERFMATGEFTLHGKTVIRHVPIEVTYYPCSAATQTKVKDADLIQIRATFPVVFRDYDIKRPSILFQKLADSVDVKVNATAYHPVARADADDSGK